MSKKQSQIIKGIAVLFMVWLHLFGRHTERYYDFISIFGKPFAQFVCGGMSPVAFFLLLGGYGLYYVYQRGKDANRYKRVFRVYFHYWVILAIFVPIGFFINPDKYPGNISNVLLNIIGLRSSYNSECWFLLPYSLVSLTSCWLFRIYDRINAKALCVITFIISLTTSTLLHFYGESFINHIAWISLPLTYLHFQLPFALGALLKREELFEKVFAYVDKKKIKTYQVVLLLMLVYFFICSVWNTGYYAFYVLFFVVSITLLPLDNLWGDILGYIGKHSVNIWMIHTFFAYHLFQSYTYSLKYPIIIFAAVILACLICSYIVNFFVSIIEKLVYPSAKKN